MGLRDPSTIDMILSSPNGKPELVIVDMGTIKDPQERFRALVEKLRAYVTFVMSNQFKKHFPKAKPKDVTILVVCKTEPTEDMKRIFKVMPRGDKKNMISVKYIVLKT